MENETLNGFFRLRREIQDYFGYEEDWDVLPLCDERDMYWMLVKGRKPFIVYSEKPITPESIANGDIDIVVGVIHDVLNTRRTLYRRDDLVAVPVDTKWDGNKYLMIFDTAKEVPASERAAVTQTILLGMGW